MTQRIPDLDASMSAYLRRQEDEWRPAPPAPLHPSRPLSDASRAAFDPMEVLAALRTPEMPEAMTNLFNAASGLAVDRTAAEYAGPYLVDGQSVSAAVASKLSKADTSHPKANDLAYLLGDADLARRAQSGQACPADIVEATQILIGEGKLPAEPAGDMPGRIRAMQSQYGIGVDGAGYTRHAAEKVASRKLPLGSDLAMRHLDSNPGFAKVEPANVQAGDIITLDPKPPATMGQNVVVRDNKKLSDFEVKARFQNNSDLTMFFATSKGPFREIHVDSSFGADGASPGGYRRETWLYNQSTKEWAHQDPSTKKWTVSPNAPMDNDTFHGAYRVK